MPRSTAVLLSLVLVSSMFLPQLMSISYASTEAPKFKLTAIRVEDMNGNDLGNLISPGQGIVLTFDVVNAGNFAQEYVGVLQISGEGGTELIDWRTGTASPGDSIGLDFTWNTEKVGDYTVRAFVWTSLVNPAALSDPSGMEMEITEGSSARIQITTASLTPLQESLQQSIEELKSEDKPFPKVTFETKTEVPSQSEIRESIESKGSFETNITATTIIEYDGPEEAGKEKWEDIVVKSPEPTTIVDTNGTVVQYGNLTQLIIEEHPEIYGEGNGTFRYGEEPRTFEIEEAIVITFVEAENPASANITNPITQTYSSNTVMGFSFVPKKIDYTVNPKVTAGYCPFCITLAEAKAGFLFDVAFGLRLPVQVDVSHPESMIGGKEYVLDTSITPLNFSAEDYEMMGLPGENGHEFFARFNLFLGLKVYVIGIGTYTYGIDSSLDMGEQCTIQTGLDCQDFVTPFGSDENGVNREFPLPNLDLSPDITGLEYSPSEFAGLVTIGLGLRLDPDIGSDRITAKWYATGDALGNGDVVYSAAFPSVYPVGPILAVDARENSNSTGEEGRSAVIMLDNYNFYLDRQIIGLYGNIQLEFIGHDIVQSDYFKLTEFNFSEILGEPVIGQHYGVGAIASTIPVKYEVEPVDEADQIKSNMMSISGVVGVSVNATHVNVMLEDIESTILVPKQIGDREVFRDVSGPICSLSANATNPCQDAWEQLGNGEYLQMRLLNITGVTSVSFEGTTIVLLVENNDAREAIPDRIFGQTVRIESGIQPAPVERSDVSECFSLFSGAATLPYSAESTITIDSMQSSYHVDFDYVIAFGDDSDTYEANSIAVDPSNVIFREQEIISMVLFSNEAIPEDVVSLYHKDVSDCDILFNQLAISASDRVMLETLSIEQIEPSSGMYLVKIAIPDKRDVSDDYNKLVIQYMDNEESAVIYVIPNVEIESSDSEVALCYNLFNGTMATPTVANDFISITAVHGTYDVDADYSRLEDDLDSRGFVYYLNPDSSDAEDTIFVEGEKITFAIRSNGGGSSTDSEAIVTLYTKDVPDCDIVFQPESVPSNNILQLSSTNVTDLGDGTYLHEVVIPSRSVVGDDFTKLFISFKDETESRVYYSLPNLRIIASDTNDSQNVDVSITNGSSTKTSDAYAPNPITINIGNTVIWTNNDTELHTVTSGSNATADGKFSSSPDLDPLSPGDTFSHTFTEIGEYPYYCGLHPSMVGTVIVAAN